MRTIIRLFSCTTVILVMTLVMSVVTQRTRYAGEMRSIVSDALVQTAQVLVDCRYEISTNEAFIAEFEQNFLRLYEPPQNVRLKLEYFGVDIENKIMHVHIQQTMPYLFFKDHTFSVSTTQAILIEQQQEEVTWYDIRYHQILPELLHPDTPFVHIGGTNTTLIPALTSNFLYWRDVYGNRIDMIAADFEGNIDLYPCFQ